MYIYVSYQRHISTDGQTKIDFSLATMNILSAAIYYHMYHGNLWQLTFLIYYCNTITKNNSGQIVIQYDRWAADMER